MGSWVEGPLRLELDWIVTLDSQVQKKGRALGRRMVRFRIGRFAGELNYARTRGVLKGEERRRMMTNILGHAGYITGALEYLMTDMISLRMCAITGASWEVAPRTSRTFPPLSPLELLNLLQRVFSPAFPFDASKKSSQIWRK